MVQPKTAKVWRPEQVEFMRFLALPKKARQPKTQREFAKLNGVDEATLSDWKRIDGFMAEVKRIAVSLVDDDVPDIIAKMISQAKSGSFVHQQAVLDMADVYTPRTRQELTGRDGGAIEIDDASAARERLARQLATRHAAGGAPEGSGDPQ